MSAQLTPVFPSDLIKPGDIYFARLDSQRSGDIQSWWLVLRCSEDLLPQPFLDSKNLQARTFPFWVIGRPQFVWLDRFSLFMLHPSQKSAFKQTEFHESFDSLYDLAIGAAKGDSFSIFQREIVTARDSYLSQENRKTADSRDRLRDRSVITNPEGDAMFIADEDDEQPESSPRAATPTPSARKPHRMERVDLTHHTSEPVTMSSIDLSNTPSLSDALTPTEPTVRIKTEAEESQVQYATAVNAAERVRIFIATKEFTTSRKALEMSPVLASFIQKDDVGLFIMHPKLNESREEDFLTVLDFMQRGEFSPKLIDRSAGQRRPRPMALDGLISSEDYSKELIRCGRLYLLGKVFQIVNLNAYIVRRITTTQYCPYSVASLITLARIVFRYSGHHRAGYQQGSISQKEPLEQWLINVLAENFREIMQVSTDRDLFWIMEKESTTRRLVAEIFARCAENYSKIGGIPVKLD